MFLYFCSLHSQYLVYCCCCRGFYCLQLFVFVCRRKKISVKSNKIFSTETFLLKTKNMEENLPVLDTQVTKSSLAAYYLSLFRMHSLFSHLTLRHSALWEPRLSSPATSLGCFESDFKASTDLHKG